MIYKWQEFNYFRNNIKDSIKSKSFKHEEIPILKDDIFIPREEVKKLSLIKKIKNSCK